MTEAGPQAEDVAFEERPKFFTTEDTGVHRVRPEALSGAELLARFRVVAVQKISGGHALLAFQLEFEKFEG
jgi:hypothetical protein